MSSWSDFCINTSAYVKKIKKKTNTTRLNLKKTDSKTNSPSEISYLTNSYRHFPKKAVIFMKIKIQLLLLLILNFLLFIYLFQKTSFRRRFSNLCLRTNNNNNNNVELRQRNTFIPLLELVALRLAHSSFVFVYLSYAFLNPLMLFALHVSSGVLFQMRTHLLLKKCSLCLTRVS